MWSLVLHAVVNHSFPINIFLKKEERNINKCQLEPHCYKCRNAALALLRLKGGFDWRKAAGANLVGKGVVSCGGERVEIAHSRAGLSAARRIIPLHEWTIRAVRRVPRRTPPGPAHARETVARPEPV